MKQRFPIEPKRRVVMARSWDREPESRQIDRNTYKGRIHGLVNPWIMRQLRNDELFVNTPSDTWRKD